VQNIQGMPYFVIPLNEPLPIVPPREEGVDYYLEYKASLERYQSLTDEIQSLLTDIDSCNAKLEDLQKTSSQPKTDRQVVKKKRLRRKAQQIERHFKCSYCSKSYG